MASKYWIKLYIEILDDPKMGRMPDWLFRRSIELFLLAGENGNDGLLPPVSDIAWRLRLDESKVNEALRALEQVGVAHKTEDGQWYVSHFAARQDASTSTERVQELRKRNERVTKRYKECNENVTHETYTEAEVEPESETDLELTTTSSAAPAQVFQSPRLPKGKLIDENEACRVYTTITGHTVPPSGQRGPIEQAIIDITLERGSAESTVEFLRPFWAAWNERHYSPTNAAWLLDWAVTRRIPDKKRLPVVSAPTGGRVASPPARQAAAVTKLNQMLEANDGK